MPGNTTPTWQDNIAVTWSCVPLQPPRLALNMLTGVHAGLESAHSCTSKKNGCQRRKLGVIS